MRNGARLVDGTGVLPGTIAVVFIRREYGALEGLGTIVDIGANMGTFAVHAAQCSPDARVYCYEPERHTFGFLKENIGLNGLEDRVSIMQCAVGSYDGLRDLTVGDSLTNSFYLVSDGASRQTVNCTTLRDILARHELKAVDLLKINCEGAEYEILESCSETDLGRIRNIRLEYHNMSTPERNGRTLSRFLEARGYRIDRFTSYRKTSGFIWASRTAWLLTLLEA